MMYLFDLLLAIGSIVLVLTTVASASRSRSQRRTGIWTYSLRQSGYLPNGTADRSDRSRDIAAAGMQ